MDGFLEYPKLFSDKIFHIDLDSLSSENIGTEMQGLTNQINISRSDLTAIYKAIIKSGLFDVKKKNDSTFVLTLTDDITSLNADDLLNALDEVSFIPDSEIAQIKEGLSSLTAKDVAQINEVLKKINETMIFEITIHTSQRKVSSYDIGLEVNLKELMTLSPLNSSEYEDFGVLSITESADITYYSPSISFSSTEAKTIHISEIISAMTVMQKKMMESWENNYNDTSWENTEWNYEDSLDIEEVNYDALDAIPADAWYRPYAETLIYSGVISDVNPTATVTEDKLYTMLIKAGASPDYNMKGSTKLVSKLGAIRYIIQAYHPGELNYFKYALDNGIVNSGLKIENAKNTNVTESEVYKILVETMNR